MVIVHNIVHNMNDFVLCCQVGRDLVFFNEPSTNNSSNGVIKRRQLFLWKTGYLRIKKEEFHFFVKY